MLIIHVVLPLFENKQRAVMHEYTRCLSYTHRHQFKHNCNYICHTKNTACVNTKTHAFCIYNLCLCFLPLFAQTAIMSLNSIDKFTSVWRTSVFSVRYEPKLCILLGAFAKLRIANIGFVMSVCLHGITRLSLDGFLWNLVFEYYSKVCQESLGFIKIGQEWRVLYMKATRFLFIISRSFLVRMRNVSDERCRENQNTHFVLNNFFSKNVPFMRYVEKYFRAGQATDDNMAYAHIMPNN